MLEKLKNGLREAIDKITKAGYVDKDAVEELIRDLQRTFLATDVDVKLLSELSKRIRNRALKEKPAPGMTIREHVIKAVYEELVRFVGEEKPEIKLGKQRILLIGLFGAGKTSSASKLARFYQRKGLKPAMIACDVHRPAAPLQLKQLGDKIGVPVYTSESNDPIKILYEGLEQFRNKDVIIVDSAGRDAIDKELAEELKKLAAAYQPDETLLVVPADIGQAAGKQAREFQRLVGITGIVITKLDATAKGGGAIATCSATGAKIKFITVGETSDDLEEYNPERFIARLIGFPDLQSLLEKAKSVIDEKKAKRMIKGEFDLEDFCSQLEGMQSLGFSQILDSIGLGKLAAKLGKKLPGGLDAQQDKMKKWKHIINSMTPEERTKPEIINSSRIRRIAKGSGTSEAEVRELLSNYNKVKKMLRKVSPAKLKRGGLGGIFKGFGI